MILPGICGPVAVDHRQGHEPAITVTLWADSVVWEHADGYLHHVTMTRPPVVQGNRLLVETAEHGPVVLRAFDPGDRWWSWPGCPAWDAFGQLPAVGRPVGWWPPVNLATVLPPRCRHQPRPVGRYSCGPT